MFAKGPTSEDGISQRENPSGYKRLTEAYSALREDREDQGLLLRATPDLYKMLTAYSSKFNEMGQ